MCTQPSTRAYFKYFDPNSQKFSAPHSKDSQLNAAFAIGGSCKVANNKGCVDYVMQGLPSFNTLLPKSLSFLPYSFAIPPSNPSQASAAVSPVSPSRRPCPDFTRTHPSRSHAHVSSEFRQTFSPPFYNNQPAIRFSPPSLRGPLKLHARKFFFTIFLDTDPHI